MCKIQCVICNVYDVMCNWCAQYNVNSAMCIVQCSMCLVPANILTDQSLAKRPKLNQQIKKSTDQKLDKHIKCQIKRSKVNSANQKLSRVWLNYSTSSALQLPDHQGHSGCVRAILLRGHSNQPRLRKCYSCFHLKIHSLTQEVDNLKYSNRMNRVRDVL